MRDVAKIFSQYSLILSWLASDLMVISNKPINSTLIYQFQPITNHLTCQTLDNSNVAHEFSDNNLSSPKSTYKQKRAQHKLFTTLKILTSKL